MTTPEQETVKNLLRENRRAEKKKAASAGLVSQLLRKRAWLCGLLGLSFAFACLGVVTLVLLYHWPRANVPVYYFTIRPAFVWFGMLAPFLVVGIFGVRLHWFLCGCVLFATGFLACEEALQVLKPFRQRVREEFVTAKMAFASYMDHSNPKTARLNVPLRIITWNVAGGRFGAEKAIEQIADLEPDIVFFQESWGGADLKTAKSLHKQFRHFHIDGGRTFILSRFPIARLPSGPLAGNRGSVWKLEITPGMQIICVNVHLSPQDLRTQVIRGFTWAGLEKAIRRIQRELQDMRGYLDLYSGAAPVVLAGDFNLPPYYPDLRQATASLKDCFAENGYGWGRTAPARLPALRVDMIFVPEDTKVYYASSVPTRHSDHHMTLAEVSIPVRTQNPHN